MIAAPTFRDARGALSVVAAGVDLPFVFDRCFWLHDVPEGTTRGGHAHHTQHQAVVCVAGALSVLVATAAGERRELLDDPTRILHLPPLTWAEETALLPGTVWVVLTSGGYDPADYFHERAAWRAALTP